MSKEKYIFSTYQSVGDIEVQDIKSTLYGNLRADLLIRR